MIWRPSYEEAGGITEAKAFEDYRTNVCLSNDSNDGFALSLCLDISKSVVILVFSLYLASIKLSHILLLMIWLFFLLTFQVLTVISVSHCSIKGLSVREVMTIENMISPVKFSYFNSFSQLLL